MKQAWLLGTLYHIKVPAALSCFATLSRQLPCNHICPHQALGPSCTEVPELRIQQPLAMMTNERIAAKCRQPQPLLMFKAGIEHVVSASGNPSSQLGCNYITPFDNVTYRGQ